MDPRTEAFVAAVQAAAALAGVETMVFVWRNPDDNGIQWRFHGDPVWSVGGAETARVFLAARIAQAMGSQS